LRSKAHAEACLLIETSFDFVCDIFFAPTKELLRNYSKFARYFALFQFRVSKVSSCALLERDILDVSIRD
jgi:hypothetical protein